MLTGIHLLLRMVWLGLLAILFFFLLELVHFYFIPLPLDQATFEFEVKPGSSLHQVADQLAEKGLLKHERFFILMAHLTDTTHKLKAGEYRARHDQTAGQLLSDLIHGKVFLRDITIVPGWTVEKILDEFHQSAYLKHDLKGLTRAQIREKLGIIYQHMEGLFWPDTYSFAKNTEESDILIKAHHMMVGKLTQAWNKRAIGLPYKTQLEALTVASLVEKETALDHERPIVAGVIVRRLKKNMYLQIDPTVIYALGDQYDGSLARSDLKFMSPYNTYVTKGLPPTPIAIPSLASIEAALHPDNGDSLYFVSNGGGRHIFSRTLDEHNMAVRHVRAQRDQDKERQQ